LTLNAAPSRCPTIYALRSTPHLLPLGPGSYTYKKEHVRSVLDAKKAETRTRSISAVIAKLDG
jgi:hypothetical protein